MSEKTDKPCPFCGCQRVTITFEPLLFDIGNAVRTYAYCVGCYARGPWNRERPQQVADDAARAAWNERKC